MNKQVSPLQAALAIVLTLIVAGGVWWFGWGRPQSSRADPQAVEQMLQQEMARPSSPAGQ
jgi:hypothetical protein